MRPASQPSGAADGLECAAYPLGFKVLTVVLVLGAGALAALLVKREGSAVWLLAWLTMLVMAVPILLGRTRLDGTRLRQDWLWPRELDLEQLAWGRIIRVPALDWIVAPRLLAP